MTNSEKPTLTSNGNNEPTAAGHAGWCLYRLDCERKAAAPRGCNCGARSLAESLRQALKWDWPNIPKDALGNIQHALRLALEAHSNETRAFPQAPETDERYNVSDGLLETLIEVAQDNGFRDVVEALRELQVRRGRPTVSPQNCGKGCIRDEEVPTNER